MLNISLMVVNFGPENWSWAFVQCNTTSSKITWMRHSETVKLHYLAVIGCLGQNKLESANQATKRLLLRLKRFCMTETFHCILNIISSTIPWLITCFFPMNTGFCDLNLLTKYNIGQHVG